MSLESSNIVNYYVELGKVFIEQVSLMFKKHASQKRRNGRQFLKNTFMIQFFTISFIAYIITSSSGSISNSYKVYSLFGLPPLSKDSTWGVFSSDSKGSSDANSLSSKLYYAPNTHQGVNDLMNSLTAKYPDIEAIGLSSADDLNYYYERNIFDTWAAVEFSLTASQISSGSLVPNTENKNKVSYSIFINPAIWGDIPTRNSTNYEYNVLNEQMSDADLFWASGYLTLQSFIANYLTQQYDSSSEIDTLIQRYPKSPVYDDSFELDISTMRNFLWKWLGATILSVCLFIPTLTYLTELVRERQFKMKDLLDISGLMNVSYWSSYLAIIFINGQATMWFVLATLMMYSIFNVSRTFAYAALCTCFILSSATFGMAFGFLVPKSKYYGLPVFILTIALTVCGAFMGVDKSLPMGVKLFFSFLSPSMGLTLGVVVIETYLYHHSGFMDYTYEATAAGYPSLNSVIGVMIASGVFYFGICLGYPFDWLTNFLSTPDKINVMNEHIRYPLDEEPTDETDNKEPALLDVNCLTQIYADGTIAVKDMSFKVKKGEVLSFLGANGAGKSTTMNMLCGTLDATFGDALINGFSITNQRTLARRNLGIAMQQDIIWDDINIEDHLYLFGRLRGLHGTELKNAVNDMVKSLGFPEKRLSLAGTLSGGQKRRLCVGLSMVGGNPVVYLDEPTAGLDPVSRRQLWELVQRNRKGRAILLTTHFMDEADVLGDRIAIVKDGRMRAIGTSKFLKQRFGVGYMIRMSLHDNTPVEPITQLISSFIPDTALASAAGTELSLRLPKEAVSDFPRVFENLEINSELLGILTYGIETTTLEEVFMRIVNEDDEQLLSNHTEANRLLTATPEEREKNRKELEERDNKRNPLTKRILNKLLKKGANVNNPNAWTWRFLYYQVKVMMYKRYCEMVRSKGQILMNIIVPLVLGILACVVLTSMPEQLIGSSNDPIYLGYDNFFPTLISGSSQAIAKSYTRQAFGNISMDYVGNSYEDLYNSVYDVANPGIGASSTEGIYYNSQVNYTVMYNASYPLDFAGAMQKLLNSAVSSATNAKLTIEQGYANLPSSMVSSQMTKSFYFTMLAALIAGSFGAGLSIVISGERVKLVKHQQLASGASVLAYWIGNYLFDFLNMYFFIVQFAIILGQFNTNKFGNSGFGEVVGSGFFFVSANIFRFYSLSYLIADVKMAQTIYFYGSLALTFVLIDLLFTVLFTTADGNINDSAVRSLITFFSFLDPTFAWYMIILFRNNFVGVLTQNGGKTFWSSDIAGDILSMLILSTIFYGAIFILGVERAWRNFLPSSFNSEVNLQIIRPEPKNNVILPNESQQAINPLIEMEKLELEIDPSASSSAVVTTAAASASIPNKLQSIKLLREKSLSVNDSDVVEERRHVQSILSDGSLNVQENAIFIHNLRKVYLAKGSAPSKVAVKNVSLTIPQGNIFCLLGANGAGKTTLLKIVSGQEEPTSGGALINGYDVVTSTSQAQRSMGLCPQFDTLLGTLTVKENLLFFGQIKGLEGVNLYQVTEAFMVALNIKRYENKLTQQLSGGNRRKVSLAVALMGAPPTVYLDEPSTGLDPVASRLMWRLLSKISSAKSTAIVLTTHNMLECEAVSTKIGIMKLGELVCLGDSQHLRSTHGTGYQLELHLQGKDSMDKARSFVIEHFQNAYLIEEHSVMLNFEIPRASITKLSSAFKLMEENKVSLGIEDYVLSQSTLEQVFLKQIQPNQHDVHNQEDQVALDHKIPLPRDYITGYFIFFLALIFPGLHHFYLGNYLRGLKYLLTLNEVYAGWFLDFFELHILIQKSVQEKGNVAGICYCQCCVDIKQCKCCDKCLKSSINPLLDDYDYSPAATNDNFV